MAAGQSFTQRSAWLKNATQHEKKAEIVPVVFQTVSRNFGRRREGVKIKFQFEYDRYLNVNNGNNFEIF